MRHEKLSELLDISIGRTPSRNKPEYWGNGHPWVSIRDLCSKIVHETKEQITNLAVKEARCRIVRKGTLLFSFKLTIGKMAFAGRDLFTNEAIAAFSIKDERKLNSEFLYYALRSTTYGGSNQAVMGKTLNSSSLAEIEIPVPPLDDQIRIAHLLGKVEGLIAQRKQHLQQLDDLLKSVFLEMFGDPVRNERGWELQSVNDFSESRLGKMRDKKFITGAHLRKYLGNSNVQWFRFVFDELLVMDFDEREREIFKLEDGDLLVCEGGEIGRCAIWKNQIDDCYFQKALHRLRLDRSKAIPEYIQYVFLFYSLFNGFKISSKATIAHLTGEKLKATCFPLPPIELQKQFATIVEKVESLKSRYQQSLTDLESLYGALSQRAFKGELDLSRVPLPSKQPEEKQVVTVEPQDR